MPTKSALDTLKEVFPKHHVYEYKNRSGKEMVIVSNLTGTPPTMELVGTDRHTDTWKANLNANNAQSLADKISELTGLEKGKQVAVTWAQGEIPEIATCGYYEMLLAKDALTTDMLEKLKANEVALATIAGKPRTGMEELQRNK